MFEADTDILPLLHGTEIAEKIIKRVSNGRLKHSHTSNALWCYIPVAPSMRLCVRPTLTQCHCFTEQKHDWEAQAQLHVQYSLMLYPCCTLYKTALQVDTDTLPLLHGTERVEKNFKRVWNGRLKQNHMSNALWCYIPVAPYIRMCWRPTLTHCHCFMEQK